jgi:hypothetical protein
MGRIGHFDHMQKEVALTVAVLVVGYSLYGVFFLAVGTLTEGWSTAGTSSGSMNGAPARSTISTTNTSTDVRFDLAETGLEYTFDSHSVGDMAMTSHAGVYAGDYDSDGWTDLLAVGGEQPVLFENEGGTFVHSGALPQIDRDLWGAVFVDYNVDGRPDIVLLAEGAPPLLLENVGGGFEKRDAFERPLPVGFGAAVGDYNRDSCPDLFIYQYGNWTKRLPAGSDNYSVSVNEDNGNPNFLYQGTCSGFERTDTSAIRGERWTLAASFVDLNGDGRPDIHESNDMNHDVLYLNRGNGRFEQVRLPERTNRHAMSSEVTDITGDRRLDVFVTNIYYPPWAAEEIMPELDRKARGNNLLANHGEGVFVGRGEQYGIETGGWGWAAVIADLDNDGDKDLFHTTRNLTFDRRDVLIDERAQRRLARRPYYRHPVVRERINVTSFRRVDASKSGFAPMDGRGAASLDYDNDGDVDLVVATTSRYHVYENRGERNNAVQVRVLGRNGSQTEAYGAEVIVETDRNAQYRRVHARTDFNSQDSRRVHIGVGNATHVDVRVVWPDGTERLFGGVDVDQRLVVTPAGIERRTSLIDD